MAGVHVRVYRWSFAYVGVDVYLPSDRFEEVMHVVCCFCQICCFVFRVCASWLELTEKVWAIASITLKKLDAAMDLKHESPRHWQKIQRVACGILDATMDFKHGQT